MTKRVLHIGNKRLSSWSMRPWLALKKAGIDFTENLIPLDQPDTRETLKALSPAGTVPVLQAGDLTIWDSLAICEWAAEQAPSLWPSDPVQRAHARAVTASMHSGFGGVRRDLSMDLQRPVGGTDVSVQAWQDIETILAMWEACPKGGDGFLFGQWSIADAFYTPVATRFRTYAIELPDAAQAYVDLLLSDPDYRAWEDAGLAETFDAPFH